MERTTPALPALVKEWDDWYPGSVALAYKKPLDEQFGFAKLNPSLSVLDEGFLKMAVNPDEWFWFYLDAYSSNTLC